MGVDFRMNDSARQAMRESLLEDVRTEIEMAREGQIPPSWQYDRVQELKQAVAKHWITEQEYSDLCAQFEAAVRSTRQITDQEYDRKIVADSAGNTLFCWNGKGNSIVSIDRDGDGFAVTVYLDAQALGETRRAVYPCTARVRCSARLHPGPSHRTAVPHLVPGKSHGHPRRSLRLCAGDAAKLYTRIKNAHGCMAQNTNRKTARQAGEEAQPVALFYSSCKIRKGVSDKSCRYVRPPKAAITGLCLQEFGQRFRFIANVSRNSKLVEI